MDFTKIENFFKNIKFPASKEEIMEVAKEKGKDAVNFVKNIPSKTYDSFEDLKQELGKTF